MLSKIFDSKFLENIEYIETIKLTPLGGLVCFEMVILQGSAKLEILHNGKEIATSFESENENFFLVKSAKQFITENCLNRYLSFLLETGQYVDAKPNHQLIWAFYSGADYTKNPNFEVKITTKENSKGIFKQIL